MEILHCETDFICCNETYSEINIVCELSNIFFADFTVLLVVFCNVASST